MFTIGQKVSTEYGFGVVTESSHRRVVILLDSGESLNIITGTFGYERIKAI